MANNDALVQRIVQIIQTHANPKQGLANLKQNQNIVPGIVAIIKNSVGENAVKVINAAPTNDVAKAITQLIRNSVKIPSNVVPNSIQKLEAGGEPEVAAQVVKQANASDVAVAISKLIRNSVKISSPVAGAAIPVLVAGGQIPAAVQAIKQANASDVATAITKLIQNKVRIPPQVADAAAETMVGPAHESVLNKLRKMFEPKPKTPNQGPPRPSVLNRFKKMFSPKNKMVPANQPNFMEPNKNNQGRPKPPPRGYVLTTRTNNTGVPKTGWYRNKGPSGVPLGPVGPPSSRNYTKMSIRELLDAMKKYPENRSTIADALRKALEKALRDIKYEYSKSRRARKLGDLLRLLPINYNGRRNASSMAVNDIRNTHNARELSNIRSNLGRVPNENIRRAFEEQRRRFERNRSTETGSRRYGGREYTTPTRRYGESNNNYTRRVKNTGDQRELLELMRRRRAARTGGGSGTDVGYVGGEGPAPPPPLPSNQRQAINNAGGVNRAMNTVVQVPGGAPEIAKAAEALNESRGNMTYAITVKGASPAAVAAVQKLGGPNNAVHVLEGLNTMSKTHGTRKRKVGGRRPKKVLRPRVAELNRVINAVKKQRLISLVAHNVTKTHNIHPNDEKLKKYYAKVLKANILRTPFAKIVRKAARKRVLPGLKPRRP